MVSGKKSYRCSEEGPGPKARGIARRQCGGRMKGSEGPERERRGQIFNGGFGEMLYILEEA